MRVKSRWFRSGEKTPPEIAGAAAFIIWRIAQQALKNMRHAGFEIAVGAQYFEFLSEMLVFLVLLADRIGYCHFDAGARVSFTTALANKAGETLAQNRAELLGGGPEEYKSGFIARLNARAEGYAAHVYEREAANFAFVRQLGLQLQEVVDERDKAWVIDQVMAIEAPEAIATLEKAMAGLLGLDEPRRRAVHGGVSGE